MLGEIQALPCRYYQIAGITIQVESDFPITNTTFNPRFKLFEVDGPGEDTITIKHHFSLPDITHHHMGQEVYRGEPWIVYRKGSSWIYVNISKDTSWAITRFFPWRWHILPSFRWRPGRGKRATEGLRPPIANQARIYLLAICSHSHKKLEVFSRSDDLFRGGNLTSLTLFPTDQILIARVLAQRRGCYFHAGGVMLEGEGLLFVGHSGAGKSTVVNLLRDKAKVLCDDRMIVRWWPQGFKVHGNWSHGDIHEVSPNSAPLKAVFFLNKAKENRLIRITDRKEITRGLLACLVRPLVTSDWWDGMLSLVGKMAAEVPCYSLCFEKRGNIVPLLRDL